MPITLNQQPEIVVPGFNPMIFLASSGSAHNPLFSYLIELKDGTGAVINEYYYLKQPVYGSVIFDSHRTIENYLSYDITNLINNTSGWQTGVNVFKKYKVKITENYPPTGLNDNVESSYVYAINSSMSWLDYVNNGLGGRTASTSSRQWLTDQPSTIKIRTGDHYEMGTICMSNNAVDYLKIETFDESGTLLKTATKANPFAVPATDAQRFISILCGPADLNAMSLTTGTQPLIQNNTHSYRVSTWYTFTPDGQSLRYMNFEIDRDCTRDGSYQRLFWLNPLGRFDAFNFTFTGEDTIEVEKSRYDKLLGNLTTTSFTYNTYQQSTSVYHSKIKQKYKLRSGFINTETATWLKELIASPLVYLLVPNSAGVNKFVACTVDNTSYTSKKTEVEKLFNIEIDVTLSVDSQRQRL